MAKDVNLNTDLQQVKKEISACEIKMEAMTFHDIGPYTQQFLRYLQLKEKFRLLERSRGLEEKKESLIKNRDLEEKKEYAEGKLPKRRKVRGR